MLISQITLTENGSCEANLEKGACFTGKDGRAVDLPPFSPEIDSGLFPLLLPFGQRTYERGLLKTLDKDKNKSNLTEIVYDNESDASDLEDDDLAYLNTVFDTNEQDKEHDIDEVNDNSVKNCSDESDAECDGETTAPGKKWRVCVLLSYYIYKLYTTNY